MTISAVDCISRGLVNLRANWELILVQVLQVFLVTLLILAGFLPPLAVLGWTSWEALDPEGGDWAPIVESVSQFMGRGSEALVLLLASLVLASVIWLIATLVYCYFQGAIYGILTAGDRQAPQGKLQGWRWFRTFSTRNLRGFAALYLWRYFWLLNLFVLIGLAWMVLFVPLGLVAAWGEARWGGPAALGIGCGGMIPLLFGLFVMWCWVGLAQADLAREDSGVWTATQRSLQVVGRRLGTLIFLSAIAFVLMILLFICLLVASIFMGAFSATSHPVQTVVSLVMTLVQWLVSGVMTVGFAAILVSLMRSESPRGATT